MSVDPGVSPYANEHQQPSPPPTSPAETGPLQTPAPIHLLDSASQRGRMRLRRRSSADNLVFQRDPVAHLNRPLAPSQLSPPLATEEEVIPTSSHVVQSPTTPTSSTPLVETPSPACGSTPPPNLSTALLNFLNRHPSTQDSRTLSRS
jgi:hypothetical protein